MPEKIGKYEVVERIGRGGMGMIFKARDPILDRLVALKVISSDIDITDELRARFFREAQACARLSHPNIVTVYDMGEDDARLYIVMELLDGEELRRLISARRPAALEDKLAIMVQVCEGLHYAHEKGVVHRDIKPGNIMVSSTGQAKILDFGIAHIANTAADLTRTGLIMGTLRYISPEQVRGRADRRSDMYSVGAVFYEFLASRPPFTGDDPMQLLEQLRMEDPPPLTEVDADLPPELAAVVARAMRKDPTERYPDLEQMSLELDEIRRGLIEESHRVRARVREQRGRLIAFHSAFEEVVGCDRDEHAIPTLDDRGRLATMQGLERDFVKRIEDIQAKIARADALAPSLQRGLAALAAGQLTDAVREFEAIVGEIPEHRRAAEALGEAQARVSAERRRQRTAELVESARAAMADGAHARCLEILEQVAAVPPPAEAEMEVASLREAAQAALTALASAGRLRAQAEQMRERMAQARDDARAYAATPYATAQWQEAEAESHEGDAAVAREAYADAQDAFSRAEVAYRGFEAAAREAQTREREAVNRAHDEMSERRARAQEVGAPQYEAELWAGAEAKASEAQSAVEAGLLARARVDFIEAGALYQHAGAVAGASRERLRLRAEEARDRAALGRQQSEDADVPRHAPALWTEAVAKAAEADALLARQDYTQATEAFLAVAALHRRADSLAQGVRRRLQGQSEQARQIMSDSRRSADGIDARGHASANWEEAESVAASGEAAFTRGLYAEATSSFERAAAAYRLAEELAREAMHAIEAARAHAETARDASRLARSTAVRSRASEHASNQWRAAEGAQAQAGSALDGREYTAARALFTDARRLYESAAQAASEAREAEDRRVDGMVTESRRLFATGDIAACLRRLSEVLELRPEHTAAAELRREAEARARVVEEAAAKAQTIDEARGSDDPERTRLIHVPMPSVPAPAPATSAGAVPAAPRSPADGTAPSEREAGMPTAVTTTPKQIDVAASKGLIGAGATVTVGTVSRSSPAPMVDATVAPSGRRPAGVSREVSGPRLVVGRRHIVAVLSGIAITVLAIVYGPQFREWWWPPPPSLEALSKQVTEARDEAVRAGARTFASFEAAKGKHENANAALARKDVKAAEPLYQEALAGYRQAKSDAERAMAAVLLARDRAAKARKVAETAGAPVRAPALWVKAETAQREAEDALNQHKFDRAQTLFGDAEHSYGDAERQATQFGRADADTARKLAAGALRDAERADARRLASAPFASAQQKEDEAAIAFDQRQWPSSAEGFKEAARLYRQSAQDAAASRRALLRAGASQAQERGTAARRDAEQASAGQRAAILFAWAERKQRGAQAALGRSEYDEAARLFGEAQADFETAAQEARRGDGGAPGQPSAQQAQRRAALYRERAIKAGAERLAQDRFTMARAKEEGADVAMRQLSFPLASQSYGEAGDRYLDAARRAGERLEANTARSRMQAEKQRASQRAPEFKAALTEEEYGTSAYERLAYREAAERFSTALALYTKAAAKAVAGSPPSPPPGGPGLGELAPGKH